jgi:hypothetical protein
MDITSSISGSTSLAAGATLTARRAASAVVQERAFLDVLRAQQGTAQEMSQGEGESEKTRQMRAKVRDVSEKYIAQALVQPLLKQARDLRDDTPPFGATEAEKQFGGLMDERTALDMVKRGRWGIVENVENRLLRAAGLTPVKRVPQTSIVAGGGL